MPLAPGAGAPDPAQYGGDITAWVKNPDNFARLMAIITLADPDTTMSTEERNFDALELRFSKPAANATDTSTRLGSVEFVRLLRFIRLWRKTGWTIEQTDVAICALYRADQMPLESGDIDTVAKLDAGFLTLLPRLGVAVRTMRALKLNLARDLPGLLACWSEIGTHGDHALYRQMFLNAGILSQDVAFADDGYGNFLNDEAKKLLDHTEALRAAFSLTADELDRILTALAFDGSTPLTFATISAIFRRAWLARKLRLSIRELLLFIALTGLDPFILPDPTRPAISTLVALVQAMRERSLKPAVALSLIWNQDLSGKSDPDPARVLEFARTLRGDFAGIDDQFTVAEDSGSDVARVRIALVYGQDDSDTFIALLENILALDVPYTHATPALETAITSQDPELAYDDFRHRLSHTGLISTTTREALKAVPGISAAFQNAIDGLFARGQDARESFFSRHPELNPLYDIYIASTEPSDQKRRALLAALSPELARRRKRQQAMQRLNAATSVELDFVRMLLDQETSPYPLHAAGDPDRPALDDVLALETQGLSVQLFFRDTATGTPDLSNPSAQLDYAPGVHPLPANPTAGATISGLWQGRLEAPEPGYYNIVIEADPGATVKLRLDSEERALTQNDATWRNADPIELKAGTLYEVELTVEKVKDALRVRWETPKRPREVIPGRFLYSPAILEPFQAVYLRFLKSVSLASGLRLTAGEIAHFATQSDLQIASDGWLNAVSVNGGATPSTNTALLKPFETLLDFARIKMQLSPDDEQVLAILQDPKTATATSDGPLFALTRWDKASLDSVLTQFAKSLIVLPNFDVFRQVYDALALIQTVGASGAAVIRATTNAPSDATVSDFQAALRARYAVADWRALIGPINDEIRSRQRDALVASILHGMRNNPGTEQIDTPDKLFEYFLMDVQMEPCMQTSRIRNALSSVQLFTERCLMNLEESVSPASINGAQWAWMKRYRVWEANRKVFLWPENWLEPELRDDKSPFFKELESKLLQSDITEDSAASALLDYLSSLEEVAKLEPCGMHYLEPTAASDEKMHVVARTAGAHRKYFYRRLEHGSWTPWEQIRQDIEDNPVIPVVWKNRLLLFWLRLLKKGPDSANRPSRPGKLIELTGEDLPPDPQVMGQAVLCWSEYYNGKWQAAKTSDVNLPTTLSTALANGFDRTVIHLGVAVEGDALRVFINDTPIRFNIRGKDGLIHLVAMWPGSFRLYNTHSPPVRGDDELTPVSLPLPVSTESHRFFSGDMHNDFAFRYTSPIGADLPREILKTQLSFEFVVPRHDLQDPWNAPFLFADSRHAFIVTTEKQPVWVRDYGSYGIFDNPGVLQTAQIPLVVQTPPPPKPKVWGDAGPIGSDPGVVDPVGMQRLVTADAYIQRGLAITRTIRYGDLEIGPSGALSDLRTER